MASARRPKGGRVDLRFDSLTIARQMTDGRQRSIGLLPMAQGLARRSGPRESCGTARLQAQLGEVMMRLELAENLLEQRRCGDMGDERRAQSSHRTSLPAHAGVQGLSRVPLDGV